MTVSFPSAHDSCFDIVDRNHVIECARSPQNLSTLAESRANAVRTIASSDGAIRAVYCLIICANDTIKMVKVGPRGGVSSVWMFGNIADLRHHTSKCEV